jgi:hypothetical protein
MFTPKKQTVTPGDAFENTAFEQWFEYVKGCREAALHLYVKQIPPKVSWHQVDQLCAISILLYASINPCFTAGKISMV